MGSFVLAGIVAAQECTMYFPSEKGKEIGYTYYSKPGKAESSSKLIIAGKEVSEGTVKLDINAQTFDGKGNPVLEFDYSVWCDGDNFYIDMKSTLGSMNLKELGEFKIESTDMEFPAKLSAGQTLKDASIIVKMEGTVPITMSTDLTNRKVEGFEKITTDAGTFDCVKISYDQFSKVSIIKTEGHTVEWYAPDVGLIRSESYNKKGKLMGINELSLLN
jgi:hypothetical protein